MDAAGGAGKIPRGARDDRRGGLSFRPEGEIFRQIPPCGIGLFDQLIFLFSAPALDLFLSGNGREDVRGVFEVDQLVDVVPCREALRRVGFVLMQPTLKVVGDAHVHDFVVPVGEQVNEVLVGMGHRTPVISTGGRNLGVVAAGVVGKIPHCVRDDRERGWVSFRPQGEIFRTG